MASLGRSAKVSKTQAQRAERRLSGKTVPAATRAAQSVCVCIARPPLGLKACCQLLLAYYPRFAPLPQLTEVVGNDQFLEGEGRRPGYLAAVTVWGFFTPLPKAGRTYFPNSSMDCRRKRR